MAHNMDLHPWPKDEKKGSQTTQMKICEYSKQILTTCTFHARLEQMGIGQVYEFKRNDLLNRAAKNATTSSDIDLCFIGKTSKRYLLVPILEVEQILKLLQMDTQTVHADILATTSGGAARDASVIEQPKCVHPHDMLELDWMRHQLSKKLRDWLPHL